MNTFCSVSNGTGEEFSPSAFMTHGTVYYVSLRGIGSIVFITVKLAFVFKFKVIFAN